jgi:hypothetical protein
MSDLVQTTLFKVKDYADPCFICKAPGTKDVMVAGKHMKCCQHCYDLDMEDINSQKRMLNDVCDS